MGDEVERKVMRLKDKVAAITGSGNGIGRAAALLFAREGARVAILEINEKAGQDTEKEIVRAGGKAKFIQTDVADFESVKKAFNDALNSFGCLHVLYNNASVFLGGQDSAVADLGIDMWNKILGINLTGLFHCCKIGIPQIIQSGGGSVINTSSSAGLIGIPKCDAYTATKGATISLTRSMAVEYGPHKVRVNCIAPAAILTDMVQQSNFGDPDFDESVFLRTTPVRRWGTPEEIARVALFLASDESSYLNGVVIAADGGITIT
ncbi:MAG: SDR family NAD(P)-dependent oxidoreductase [Candidatus Omnitrophota bacterium]